jgi:hypothetical protein
MENYRIFKGLHVVMQNSEYCTVIRKLAIVSFLSHLYVVYILALYLKSVSASFYPFKVFKEVN